MKENLDWTYWDCLIDESIMLYLFLLFLAIDKAN